MGFSALAVCVDLRIGVGRDMRLQAPEMAGRLRDGLVAEGAAVRDAGMVGTEILYFLVGARQLDGGAMITASHNPKAYTGVKLVREGALALSGDTGITAIRDLILAGLGDAPGGGRATEVDIAPSSASGRSPSSTPRPCGRSGSSSTAATAWPARWSDRCWIGSRSS